MWQIIGQPKAVSLLQRSLEKGSLAHAFLFTGPPHVGKMTLANNLAQAVNCKTNESPCGQCSSCQKIAHRKHADVQFISLITASEKDQSRSKTEISIDQIRQIHRSANLPPFEGIYKVFIIDGAEFLSSEAANCLLKTLEEPSEKVLFILLAKSNEKIPDTVISRCQKLELIPLSTNEVERELIDRWSVETQKARLLAKICKGCIGWAISASQDDELIRRFREERDSILDIVYYGYEERFTYAAQLAKQFVLRKSATIDVLNLWLDLWRDLMLIKIDFTEAIINIDIKEKLSQLTEVFDLSDIRRIMECIMQSIQNLNNNANPRLVLEVLMMDIPTRRGERVGS
jgi:DNA polymerase-3 subunit delta'